MGEFNGFTAKLMGNLGFTYQMMGKFAEAEKMFNNSMKVLVAIQGPEDVEVWRIHNRLAYLYNHGMEEFDKAEEHYLRGIRILEKLFGRAYSQLQFDYSGLINLYKKTGEEAKMMEYCEIYEEWEKLQEEKKNTDDKKKEKEEDKSMEFKEIVQIIRNT